MLKAIDKYSHLSDQEWIEAITAPDADRRLQESFFQIKCGPTLRYISLRIYKCHESSHLAGELYEFLSDNNWSATVALAVPSSKKAPAFTAAMASGVASIISVMRLPGIEVE